MMNVPAPLSVVAQGGILRWDDGRTVPDVMTAVYEYPGFLLEITANLGSTAHGVGQVIMGSEASLTFTRRGLLVTFEPEPSPVAYYGLNGWTKAMKEQYLASLGFSGGRRPENKPAKPPQEIEVAQGLEHHEYFIQSLRDGTPSKETAEEGHAAAGAAHLANVAMKKGSRMRWEFAQSKITAG
jgi:hypothetical protein